MPIVSVGRDKLFEALGRTYTDDEFQELCFEYGIELDDVTSEREMLRKEHHNVQSTALDAASDEVLYKIDIPANRYDMLCLEGISRALNVFLGRCPPPSFSVVPPQQVLRDVTFDQRRYQSFIDLQDKLHTTLCRQRSLVAIGTHDLDTLQGPFTYEALPPEQIQFVPLKQTRTFDAGSLMQHYLANDNKLRKYVPIIQDSIVYPVIYDAQRTVLSLPPIINGQHSAITLKTTNVFIECTATDLTKAEIVLQTVCAMFSEHCTRPFTVEPVEVVDARGERRAYPSMDTRSMQVSVPYLHSMAGIDLPAPDMARLLTRMQLAAEVDPAGASLTVHIPVTRSDVLHPCDVVEDVAIAHGYNNIRRTLPTDVTVGRELPINQMSDALRAEMAMAGWTEVLTWALISRAENFTSLRIPEGPVVGVGNPATAEFEVVRSALLPGLLKTLASNKDAPLPLRLFELSDVVLLSQDSDTGARNQRRVAALQCGKESGFEVVQGLLGRIMDVLGVPLDADFAEPLPGRADLAAAHLSGGYSWRPSEVPTFFPGRQAEVFLGATRIGVFGIVHPDVLAAYDIKYVVSAMELELEHFCYDQLYQELPTHFPTDHL